MDDQTEFVNQYRVLTEKEERFRASAMAAAVARARLVAKMHLGGLSYGAMATMLGLSRSRVQQLSERGQA